MVRSFFYSGTGSADGEGEFRCGGNLIAHLGNSSADTHLAEGTGHGGFQGQHIAGLDLALELGILDAAEVGNLALVLLQRQDGTS